MGLTVSEKDHFRKRLQARCAELRTGIEQTQLHWARDCKAQAADIVAEHFGVEPALKRLEALQVQRDALDQGILDAERKIVSKMTGLHWKDVSTVARHRHYEYNHGGAEPTQYGRYPQEARIIVENHTEHQAEQLKAAHPVGQQLHQVNLLEGELEDELLACGSHAQLQRMWKNACEKLNLAETESGERALRGINVREKGEKGEES